MESKLSQYNQGFYRNQSDSSFRSAEIVLRFLFETIYRPTSILDIGCGTGTWLAAANQLGVEHVFGIDGSNVAKDSLRVPPAMFQHHDLSETVNLGKEFDMGISLEVAEHISHESHDVYFKNLEQHADFILFSAAIPYQGGTGHVSENWPNYWYQFFSNFGYQCFDILRPALWGNRKICFWYRQNLLIFARKEKAELLINKGAKSTNEPMALVHPEMFIWSLKRSGELSSKQYERDILYLSKLHMDDVASITEHEKYGELYNNAF